MKQYFIAIALAAKPFMRYQSVGSFTDAEFEASEYFNNPLVFDETNEPSYQFGVCSNHIFGGEIVSFTPAELVVFEAEFVLKTKIENNKVSAVNQSSFDYDSETFPMDETSRLFYSAVEKITGDRKMMTIEGALYDLVDANRSAFITAYYTQLRILTQPDV